MTIKAYSFSKWFKKIFFVFVLVTISGFTLSILLSPKESKVFTSPVQATESECRNFAETDITQCEDNIIMANVASCTSQCEAVILDGNITNYSAYTGMYSSDLCTAYCEYGYDFAADCKAYATDYNIGSTDSYAYASCFESCAISNPGSEVSCDTACNQIDAISCENSAIPAGLNSYTSFCSEIENQNPANFSFCNQLESFGGAPDSLSYCLGQGHYSGVDAFFCAEASSTACDSLCTSDGGISSLCNAVSGACQYVSAVVDTAVPTFTFNNNTWNSFDLTNTLKGTVTDASTIVSVQVATNELAGPWISCSCSDGACDSTTEDFICDDVSSTQGTSTLYFKAQDSQGNVHTVGNYHTESLNIDTLPSQDLVFSLNMDSTTLNDQTLFAYAGNHYVGVPTVTTGHLGNALDYAGIVNSQFSDNLALYDFSSDNEFTAEAYIYSNNYADGVYGRVLSKMKNDNSIQWSITIDPTGHAMCQMSTSAGFTSMQTDIPLVNGVWHKVGCTWDGSFLTIVIDGVDSKQTDLSLASASFINSNGPLVIAGEPGNWNQRAFNGLIDEVKIYKSAQPFLEPDLIPPTVLINDSYSDLSNITDNTPTFTGTITDDARIKTAKYIFTDKVGIPYDSLTTFDDLAWHTFLPDDGVWDEANESFTITADTPLVDGEQYLYIIAEDIFGNESYHHLVGWLSDYSFDSNSVVATKRFVVNAVDSTAPQVYGQFVMPDPTVDRSPYLQGYVIDNNTDLTSNISNISYKIDGGSWNTIVPLDGVYDSSKEDFSLQMEDLAIGSHTISISAVDQAGNSTETSGSSYSDDFVVMNHQSTNSSISSKDEDFVNHDFHDILYTDGVWGNGYARLKQDLEITPVAKYTPGPDFYGYFYGDPGTSFAMTESLDGEGLWFISNGNSLSYYNRTTDNVTDYGVIYASNVQEIFEFSYGSNRYLILSYAHDSFIIDINNTPENSADDTVANWGAYYSNNELGGWEDMVTDQRNSLLGIYMTGGTADNNNLIYLDLNNTPMDLTDDTFVTWGNADGLLNETNYTSFYFDQDNNSTYAFSYTYGLHTCDDAGTPIDKSDDNCYSEAWSENGVPNQVFSTEYDSEANVLWVGGDKGLSFVDLNSTADTSDDVWRTLLSTSDLSSEEIEHLSVIPSNYPVGQEILYTTRENTIGGIEINFTPNDTYDDTFYSYKIAQDNGANVNRGGIGFAMVDANSLWLNLPRKGLYQYNLSRSFESQNVIELLPNPPSNILEINNIKLNKVTGLLGTPIQFLSMLPSQQTPLADTLLSDNSVQGLLGNPIQSLSAFSSKQYSPMTTYQYPGVEFYISNDGGQNWRLIKENETVNLGTNDYLVKFKAVLNNLSGDTPILDYMKFSYAAYATPEDENPSLSITSVSEANKGDIVPIAISFVDKLGFVSDSNMTVSLELRYASNNNIASNCSDLPSTVTLVNGIANLDTTFNCDGVFKVYGYESGNPSENTYGNVITVTSSQGQATTTIDLSGTCGNGVIDDGEECDGDVGNLLCSDYEQYDQGELSCNTDCTINVDSCSVNSQIDVSDVNKDINISDDALVTQASTSEKQFNSRFWGAALLPIILLQLLTLAQGINIGEVLLRIPTMIMQIPAFLLRTFILLLRYLGIRKGGQEIGYVYDSITKDPLSLAIVRIFDENKRLVQTEVTNSFGAFVANTEKGKYYLTVSRSSYSFPSVVVTGKNDNPILNIYHGEVKTFDQEELEDISIPLDPINKDRVLRKSYFRNQMSNFFTILMHILNVLGLGVSIWAVWYDATLVNVFILLGYVLVILISLYRYFLGYKDRKVVLTSNGQPVKEAEVLLYKSGSEMLIDKRITKHDGTYRFVVPQGSYDITAQKGKNKGKVDSVTNSSKNVKRISTDINI